MILYKRFADYLGILAFYPIFFFVAQLLNSLLLALSAKMIYLVAGLLYGYALFEFASNRGSRRLFVLSVLIFSSSLGLIVIYWVEIFEVFPEYAYLLILVLDSLPLVAVGLSLHDMSKVENIKILDTYGGAIILSIFLLLVRLPITIIAGIIILTYSLVKASQTYRKMYFVSIRRKVANKT